MAKYIVSKLIIGIQIVIRQINKGRLTWILVIFIAIFAFVLTLFFTSLNATKKHEHLLQSKSQVDEYVNFYMDASLLIATASNDASIYFRNGGSQEDRVNLINSLAAVLSKLDDTDLFKSDLGFENLPNISRTLGDENLFIEIQNTLQRALLALRDSEQDEVWIERIVHESAINFIKRAELMIVASEANYSSAYEELSSSAKIFALINFATLVFSIIVLSYFVHLNFQNEKHKAACLRHLEMLKINSKAKSRLLAMLSHELRTPLNGILGLISLGMQGKKEPEDQKLLEQIKNSAMELHDFLGDISNIAKADKDCKSALNTRILPPIFTEKLKARLEPLEAKYGVDLQIHSQHSFASIVECQSERIFQSLYYSLSFIMKNTLQNQIVCKDHFNGKKWIWRIGLSVAEWEGATLQAESLIRCDTDCEANIERDALETTMFRSLIEDLGANAQLVESSTNSEEFDLVISFDVSRVEKEQLGIIDFSHNQHLSNWFQNTFVDVAYEFHGKSKLKQSHVVLVESGTERELETLKTLRHVAPNIHILGFGQSNYLDLYDTHLNLNADHDVIIS